MTDTRTYKNLATIEHTGSIWALAFNHSGAKLAASTRQGAVVITDVGTYAPLTSIQHLNCRVYGLQWSPDDSKIEAGFEGGTTHITDYAAQKPSLVGNYLKFIKIASGSLEW